ncbi:MAG: endopeptidase La [bacterium]|nr:endopeptidase La [bacterium]
MSSTIYLDGKPVKMREELPLVTLREKVVFPSSWESFSINRDKSKLALDASTATNGLVVFVCQKNAQTVNPDSGDMYDVGTIARIRRFWKVNGDYNLTVEGLSRVYIKDYVQSDPYFIVRVEDIPEISANNDEVEALVSNITAQMNHYREVGGHLSLEASIAIFSAEDPNQLCNAITAGVDFKPMDKQLILEMTDTLDRLKKVSELLAHEIRVLEIGQKIANQTQERVKRVTKEAILREQMSAIKKELGEDPDEDETDISTLKKQVKSAKMPHDVQVKIEKEVKRLSKMPAMSPEVSYLRTYIDTLLELPWSIKTEETVNVSDAKNILDEDHYGLDKAKERILEFLAIQKLAGKLKGPILCFAGSPGVGKTSIGKSIARALGRKFVKVSLGGIRDEAEIRGHRRTYVGALPGRIIQGIKQAGSNNPVFMLDEIDKIGNDFRGDPSAALLEALDPEQNHNFSDHYLEVPFDLSNVMFIATANYLENIPHALRDRLEIIEFPGYTENEKFKIAKKYLIPKQVENHGLKKDQLKIDDEALEKVITYYTRESGVRNLEREMSAIIRKIGRKVAEGDGVNYEVDVESVAKYLGPEKFTPYFAEKENEVGMSTGLFWTEMGGGILVIEVSVVPGKGQLTLTGHLGEVMKESAIAAISYIRSRATALGLAEKFNQKVDIHVHVPSGAVPKDGPSAGAAICGAIVSALTRIPTRKEVAMTGEITLRGRVTEIGGLKEKIIGAHRAGIKTIIIPKDNQKDMVEIPDEVKKDLTFHFVEHMDQVLPLVLTDKISTKPQKLGIREGVEKHGKKEDFNVAVG